MKNFIYFESGEGGMEVIEEINSENDLKFLRSWMHKSTKSEDMQMVKWMQTALIGQKYNHRLGCLVRVLDI